MSNHKIKLSKPCVEDWDNMTLAERGKFCSICSKEVIDMTSMDIDSIIDILSKENDVCGKTHHSQISKASSSTTIIGTSTNSYSKIVAGILLASTLSTSLDIEAKESSLPMVISQNSPFISPKKTPESEFLLKSNISQNDSLTFSAIVVFKTDQQPIENADVMFVSANLILKTKTDENGVFSLKIPKDIIDDSNLFRITHATSIDRSDTRYGFKLEDYVLDSNDLKTKFKFNVTEDIPYMGAVTYIKNAPDPVVLYNGSEINYKVFRKALDGNTKKFDMNEKRYYFFDENAGAAIYGMRGYNGVYLIYDE